MTTKRTSRAKKDSISSDELRSEYVFDYAKAKPNRFVGTEQAKSKATPASGHPENGQRKAPVRAPRSKSRRTS